MKKKKILVPKSPQAKEIFNIKREFLKRNYEGFNQWSQGIKILNDLFQLIPNINFWGTYKLPKPFPVFWLIKSEGKSFLLQEYEKYLNNQRKLPPQLAPERFEIKDKIGEDMVMPKVKTLRDFLK